MTYMTNTKYDIIIATDRNFDYVKINQNSNISDLLDVFYTLGMVPTIRAPLRSLTSSYK